jgi:chorismate dehydratase
VSAPLRVGRISALNMYPLYHHLEQAAGSGFAFTDGLPAALNAAVLDGRLDVSAMSSIEYARNWQRLRLLPVASIAASGAVDSIQLFSRVPVAEVRSVAVTPHSATSVTLLRVLLGPDVPFRTLDAPLRDALRDVDGVLLIADEALVALRAHAAPHATDLAAAWRERTGLPMVFAVWAAREEAAAALPAQVDALTALLGEAKARFAADPEEVVAAAAARFPFPAGEIRAYFRRLRYDFGDEERAGLGRFLEMARVAGELHDVPALAA